MNRYTQLSTTQFNPLSMEELSVLPAMMRQRHDAANLEMEKRRAELNAFAISSPEYSQEAQALIAQMNKGIDDISDSLASKGYNSLTRSNLSSMNRDYQQLVSPTGRLGQMANAEKLNAERYREHLEAAQKANQSTDDAMRNWALNKQNYTGYDNEGNITAINSLGVPKYANMITDLKDIKGIIGESQRRLDKAGGGDIQIRSDGSAWVVNKSGSVQRITNDTQLLQALEFLKTKWLSPDGEGFKSAMYQGKNLNSIVHELNSGISAMRVDKIIDNTNYSGSLSGYKNPKDGDGDGSPGPYNAGMFNIDNRYDMSISKYNTHALFKDRLGTLNKDKTKLTASELREYEALEAKDKMLQDDLKRNKAYQEARKIFLAENKVSIGSYSEKDPRMKSAVNDNLSMNINSAHTSNLSPKAQDALNRMRMIENETFQNLPSLVSSYAVPKTNNPKANNAVAAIGDNVLDIFRGGNDRILNNFEIVSVVNDKGKIVENPSADSFDDYQSNVLTLLRKAKKVELIGSNVNKVHNDDEAQFNIQIDKNDKTTLDWFRGSVGANGNVTVTLKMKKGEDAKSIPMIKGLIANLYHNYGGESGKYFAQEMANSSTKTNMNEFFEANNFTYGDLNNNSSFLKPREIELIQQQILHDASIEKGIDPQNLTPSQADKLFNDYIQNHSQQVIRTYNN